MDIDPALQLVWWTVIGLFVGSFLNAAIYRLPREHLSVTKPARSFCPACKRQLSWYENIPLVSWLVQRGRCRGCSTSISWRYPLVEALTAALWLWVAWETGVEHWALVAVRVLVVSALIVATFVDFELYEIPDEVSIGGMLAAPLLSFLVPALHADSPLALEFSDGASVDRTGALLASLVGVATGYGILRLVAAVAERAYGREAMGYGDVKLLGAAGGFVGPLGALAVLLIASFVGALVGVANIARLQCFLRARVRARRSSRSFARSLAAARVAGQMLPFGPYLALGTALALVYWKHMRGWF
jgi:leader peptidase (prepilin peptidase)/N-methyltransferase